jgi:hypothetical protein
MGLYFLSHLDQNRSQRTHSSCSTLECLLTCVEEDQYETRHAEHGCQCPHRSVDIEKISQNLERGNIPLIMVTAGGKDGKFSIRIVEHEPFATGSELEKIEKAIEKVVESIREIGSSIAGDLNREDDGGDHGTKRIAPRNFRLPKRNHKQRKYDVDEDNEKAENDNDEEADDDDDNDEEDDAKGG